MKVDLFVHKDKNSETTKVWQSFFCEYLPDWKLNLCFADEILRGDATHVLFPGGSGSAFYKALGTENSDRVVKWVNDGGSYIGVCAGAYLASSHLKITPVIIPDKAWERGLHQAIININGKIYSVNYHNGPIFKTNPEGVEIWGTFKSNFIAKNGYFPMQGTAAILHNTYGKGIVSLFSPHLEKSSDALKKELAFLFGYIENKTYKKKWNILSYLKSLFTKKT